MKAKGSGRRSGQRRILFTEARDTTNEGCNFITPFRRLYFNPLLQQPCCCNSHIELHQRQKLFATFLRPQGRVAIHREVFQHCVKGLQNCVEVAILLHKTRCALPWFVHRWKKASLIGGRWQLLSDFFHAWLCKKNSYRASLTQVDQAFCVSSCAAFHWFPIA